MINILLTGCGGRMGRTITSLCESSDKIRIIAGVDIAPPAGVPFPVYSKIADVREKPDVIVDFTHVSLVPELLRYCVEKKLPLVLATTGIGAELQSAVAEAAKSVPVFKAANMSLGVNLLMELVKKCVKNMGDAYDIEIIEKHHNQKLDAPSGTALMLADAAASVLPEPPEYVYDRHSVRRKRDKHEIGIHAIRGGTIVGEHDVIFAGFNEVLTLSHSASSRDVFASGALKAAEYMAGIKKPGLYAMNDMLAD